MNEEEEKKKLETKEGLSDFFSDLGNDDSIDSDYDEVDQYIDEVMALLENYGNISGGIVTLNTIFKYLQQRNYPDIEKEDCFEIISRLRVNRIILDELVFNDIPDFYLYIFKEIDLDEDITSIIKIYIQNPKMTKNDIKGKLSWDNSKIEKVILKLQNHNLIKIEDNVITFPGIPL